MLETKRRGVGTELGMKRRELLLAQKTSGEAFSQARYTSVSFCFVLSGRTTGLYQLGLVTCIGIYMS